MKFKIFEKRVKMKSSYIWKTVFLLAVVSSFAFIIMKPADRLVKTVSVNKLSSFGQLYLKKTAKISTESKKPFDESKLSKDTPDLEITDSYFIDRINGIEVRNPTYKFFDGAYFVNNSRKTFIVMDFSEKKDDPNIQFDVSSYKTRKAYSVFDGAKDTGDVVYCQVDALSNEYVFLAHFENENSKRTDCVYELSKTQYEEKSPSQLGICALYQTDSIAFEWKFSTRKNDSLDFEKKEVIINDDELYFSPHDDRIEKPYLVSDENAFFKEGKKIHAAMYFVGEKWDGLNSFDVSSYSKMNAYDVYAGSGEKACYKIYILSSEKGTDVFLAYMGQVNDLPSYCEYLILLKEVK